METAKTANFKDKTAQGYEVIALVRSQYMLHEGTVPEYIAVVKSETDVSPYILCYSYDITDGTWGNGIYLSTYDAAMKRLAELIM